ncbi:MAG: hypothetical protein HN366_23145 [Deltaproteobacteria bacterium]|nr:hypothetical protein [Deltaproteobacteria bacterium]
MPEKIKAQKIREDTWLWLVAENPGENEQFLGQIDTENNISFIPTFLEKDAALQGLHLLVRDKKVKFEIQAIQYRDLAPKLAEEGFFLFVLDAEGNVLEKITPQRQDA